MKLKKESTTSVIRHKYTVQFKEQVLARADRDRHSHTSRWFGTFWIIVIFMAIETPVNQSTSWREKLDQADLVRFTRKNNRIEELVF